MFLSDSGTSSLIILKANPSTIAVLPTPGSPIKTGLFLVLLESTCILLLISSSLPITGSSCPFFASSVKLVENFFKESELIDFDCELIVCPFLSFIIVSFSLSLFIPLFVSRLDISVSSQLNIVYSKISGDIKSSSNSFLIFCDFSNTSIRSLEKKILIFSPIIFGLAFKKISICSLSLE